MDKETSKTKGVGRKFLLAILSLALLSGLAMAACPAGMISYWKLNENTGTAVADSTGGNTGTIHGATWTTGKVGSALSFDGSDTVEFSNSPWYFADQKISVEFWFKTGNDITTEQVIFGRSVYWGALSVNVQINNGKLWYYMPTDNQWVGTSANINANQWYHAVGGYNGTHYLLYLNGVKASELQYSGVKFNWGTGTWWTALGAWHGEEGYTHIYFKGIIDEFAIYNRTLTLSEIQNHYNNSYGMDYCGSAGAPPEPAPTCGQGDTVGIVSYWRGEDNADDLMGSFNAEWPWMPAPTTVTRGGSSR